EIDGPPQPNTSGNVGASDENPIVRRAQGAIALRTARAKRMIDVKQHRGRMPPLRHRRPALLDPRCLDYTQDGRLANVGIVTLVARRRVWIGPPQGSQPTPTAAPEVGPIGDPPTRDRYPTQRAKRRQRVAASAPARAHDVRIRRAVAGEAASRATRTRNAAL